MPTSARIAKIQGALVVSGPMQKRARELWRKVPKATCTCQVCLGKEETQQPFEVYSETHDRNNDMTLGRSRRGTTRGIDGPTRLGKLQCASLCQKLTPWSAQITVRKPSMSPTRLQVRSKRPPEAARRPQEPPRTKPHAKITVSRPPGCNTNGLF